MKARLREAEETLRALRSGSVYTLNTAEPETEETEADRTERLLQQERDLLQEIMNGAKMAHLVYLDRDFNFVRVNEAYARTCGFTPEEMIGRNHFELYPDSENEEIFIRVRDTGIPAEFHDKPFTFPDQPERGTTYWDWTLTPVKEGPDKVAGLVFSLFETTGRKKMEQALQKSGERLRLVLEASSMGTFEVDLITGAGRWNDTEYSLLGLRPGDAPPGPETFFRFVHPEDVGSLKAQWKEALKGGSLDTEFRVVRADGQERWLAAKGKFVFTDAEATAAPAGRGEAAQFMGVNFDITDRKRAEKQIMSLNAQLKHRVAELNAANRELDSFAYSVSHDLREPLRAVSGFIKILSEDYADRLDAKGLDHLARVYRASAKMGRLIEDLLYLSRITRQELKRSTVDLSRRAASIIEDLRAATPDRQVDVDIEEGLHVFADPGLMDIVLTNLLRNAWKFTSRTDNANIRVGAFSQDGKTVFYVKDNGAGFDPQYREKLFASFQRLHSDQEFEGTGIGLSIVDRIIRRHGGRIWAEGEKGKGAAFYFTLDYSVIG